MSSSNVRFFFAVLVVDDSKGNIDDSGNIDSNNSNSSSQSNVSDDPDSWDWN